MRTGKKKVLIGSTDKCGTGVNVQTHLVAMHHVDCPWKPSSIEQREGRGIRQGNENEEVAIYRYVTKGTFDAYNWSLIENKQRFISQVMTSKAVSRSCEDIDEATLSYAEIKAVATGNPLIKEKMEIDNDVQRLKLLKASYDNQRYGLQDNFMIKYPKLIKTAKTALLAKGFREAGQTVANAFRTFADKPEVDYSQKEQKHPITKAVLAPMKAVKKMLVSMELHLDASIDKLDNLAMNVQIDKEKRVENTKSEKQNVPDRAEAEPERVNAEIVYTPMVAEAHEYQYNADAFEARGGADVKVGTAEKVSKVREDKAR